MPHQSHDPSLSPPDRAALAEIDARYASERTDAVDEGAVTEAKHPGIVLAVIAVAQLLIVLDATVVNIALPLAAADLDMSATASQWVVTGYTLAFGALLLLGGRISDVVGSQRVFLIGMAGFAAASAVGGFAVNSEMLLAARIGQGVFAAALAPSGLALLSTTFSGEGRAKAFAVYGAVAAAGSAFGLLVGGLLTEYLSWRWCLLVNLPIAAAALVAGRWALPVVPARRQSLDLVSGLGATVGLGALVYGFTRAVEEAWTEVGTVACFVVALLGLMFFFYRQANAERPLLPLRILNHRDRAGALVAMALIPAALIAVFFYLSFYLQQVRGYSPVETGLAFLPLSLGVILAAALASNLAKVAPPRWTVTAGLVMAGAGIGALGLLEVDTAYWQLAACQLVLAAGAGLVFVTATNLALIGIDDSDSGVASAVVNTGQQVGGALGLSIISTIVVDSLSSAPMAPAQAMATLTDAYADGFVVAAVFPLVGAVFAACAIRAGAASLKGDNNAQVHLG